MAAAPAVPAPALCGAIQAKFITHLRHSWRRKQRRLWHATRKAIRTLRAALAATMWEWS